MPEIALRRRDLALVYVIISHSSSERDRMIKEGISPDLWASSMRPVDITLLVGTGSDRESGILNQFLVTHGIDEQVTSPSLIYRSANRLRDAKLLTPSDNKTEQAFVPTEHALSLYRRLSAKPPSEWPQVIEVSNGTVKTTTVPLPEGRLHLGAS